VWLGSLLALAGTLLITLDGTSLPAWLLSLLLEGAGGQLAVQPAAAAAAAVAVAGAAPGAAAAAGEAAAAATAAAAAPVGDALIIAAAFCYSAATVRIPVWAVRHRVPPLQLALGKSAFLAAVFAAALGLAMAAEGEPAAALWPGWRQPKGWAIILWSAAGPGALAALLHVKGQSLVSPTNAQIVFCSVPLWSALLAAVALPGEAVGEATWAGGAAIGAAGLVAALPTRDGRQG
jgi:drug/metabolite transporter (DMT)-like permease